MHLKMQRLFKVVAFMLPLSLDMKKPAMENSLSLGTEVGEMFIKTFLQTLRPDKVKEKEGYFCDFK